MPYVSHPEHEQPTPAGQHPRNWYDWGNEKRFLVVPDGHKISLVITDEDRENWQYRERGRFDQFYMAVPWINDLETLEPRFVHLSLKTPGLVAYTQNDTHGMEDRQTAVRPGRYLKKFFPHLSDDQIRAWSEQCAAGQLGEIKLARTVDDIRAAYQGNPMNSCMGHNRMSAYSTSPHFPIDAYADSDLAVAYIGELSSVKARGIVWPEKKVYNRLWGAETLKYMLENAGYSHGPLTGAKIRLLRNQHNNLVCPYLDNCDSVGISPDQKWLVINTGFLDCQFTSGVIERSDEPEDEPDWTCAHCGEERYNEDSMTVRNRYNDSIEVCDSCCESYYAVCVTCNRYYRSSRTAGIMVTGSDDEQYCRYCCENEPNSCVVDGCENTWHEPTAFSSERDSDVAERICADHAADGWTFAAGGIAVAPLDAPTAPPDTDLPATEVPLPVFPDAPIPLAVNVACGCEYCRGALQTHSTDDQPF